MRLLFAVSELISMGSVMKRLGILLRLVGIALVVNTNAVQAAPVWSWNTESAGAYTGQVDLGDAGALTGLQTGGSTSSGSELVRNYANQPLVVVINSNAMLLPEDACLVYDNVQQKWLTNDTAKSQVSPGYVCPNGDIFAGLASNRPIFTHAVDNSAMFWSGLGTYNSSWTGTTSIYAGAGGALETCREMGVGWHLPVKPELDLLYANRAAITGFQTANYWSASEGTYTETAWFFFSVSAEGAQIVNFANGAGSVQSKTTATAFRCVRSY